jgi:hypothetical protein
MLPRGANISYASLKRGLRHRRQREARRFYRSEAARWKSVAAISPDDRAHYFPQFMSVVRGLYLSDRLDRIVLGCVLAPAGFGSVATFYLFNDIFLALSILIHCKGKFLYHFSCSQI